jgi:hypothetical protein
VSALRCLLYVDYADWLGTFALAIHDDICGRQPIETFDNLVFRPHSRSRLLRALLPTILYRMSPKKCRSDYLLRHMDATIAFLQSFTGDDSKNTAELYKRHLCNAIAASLSNQNVIAYLLDGPYKHSVKVRKNMGRADKIGVLAAAAAVGNEPVLRVFINKVRSESASSELYGTPFLAAAVNGQIQAAAFILERMSFETSGTQLWTTIKQCMETRHIDMLPTLFTWYYARSRGHEISRTKQQIARWAIKTGNLEVLQLSFKKAVKLNPNHDASACDPGHDLFTMACRFGHQNIIHYFLKDGAPPRCSKHGSSSHHLTLGIQLAATHGWLVAMKLFLDSGAEVNKTVTAKGVRTDTAIGRAVESGYVNMVVLLLAYGAQIPLSDYKILARGGWLQKRSTMQLAREQGGSMNRIVEQAVEQQSRRHMVGEGHVAAM